MSLSEIITTIKQWEEPFTCSGKVLPLTLRNFWWRGFSQILTNNLRGILAEYIVASDIWIVDCPRRERDKYDLVTPEGITVEVKSASYIQSREQKDFSRILFSIRPTQWYDDMTMKRDAKLKRQADIYVFCLLSHKDKKTIDPLNMNQWEFYILPTIVINNSESWKTITLNKLERLWASKTNYGNIYKTIKTLLY